MKYVSRDDDGNVKGLFARPQSFTNEQLAEDHPDIVTYRTEKSKRAASAELKAATEKSLEVAMPGLERERAALLPDGDPGKTAALAAVEAAQTELATALAAVEAATTVKEVEDAVAAAE